MKIKRIIFWGLFSFVALTNFVFAGTGTSSAVFLRLEQGARPLGMGGAFVAVADDGNSVWWNPAGSVQLEKNEIWASYTSWLESVKTQFVNFVHPLSNLKAAVGGSVVLLGMDSIEQRDGAGNLKSSDSDIQSSAFSLNLSKYFADNFSMGLSVKGINQKLGSESGSGVAFDWGLLFRQDKLSLGLGVFNIGPKLKTGDVKNDLPLDIRAGVAYRWTEGFLLSVEGEKPVDSDFKLHLGGEWKLTPIFALRVGYEGLKNLGSQSGLTAGLGISNKWSGGEDKRWGEAVRKGKGGEKDGLDIQLDYAYLSLGDFGTSHRFSIGVKF